MGGFTGFQKTGFNTTGNNQSSMSNYNSGRSIYAVGLGRTRSSIGSITRKFNYCNLTAPDLNVAFRCTFDLPYKNTCENLLKYAYQLGSPWPHFGGTNNTNSRLTPIIGSKLELPPSPIHTNITYHIGVTSSSIDAVGAIYTGINIMSYQEIDNYFIPTKGYLQKLDRFGIIEWIYELDEEDYFLKSTPAIGQNNIVYFATAKGFVYAISTDRNLIWKKQYLGNFLDRGIENVPLSINGSIVIGLDGNLYFGGNYPLSLQNAVFPPNIEEGVPPSYGLTNLLSINMNNGTINFQYQPLLNVINGNNPSVRIQLTNYIPFIKKDVAIDTLCNNTYFCYEYGNFPSNSNYVSINGNNYYKSNLLSISKSGSLRWSFPLTNGSTMISYPMLTSDNKLAFISSYNSSNYTVNYYISAIGSNSGTKDDLNSITITITTFLEKVVVNEGTLARDQNNNIYFLARNNLYKIKNGTILWNCDVDGANTPSPPIGLFYPTSSPLVAGDGTIYFISTILNSVNNNYVSYINAVNPINGAYTQQPIPEEENTNTNILSSPSIFPEGGILVTTIYTYYETSIQNQYKYANFIKSRFFRCIKL